MAEYTKDELAEVGRKAIEQRKKYTTKRLVKVRLLLAKAAKAKITVTDAEVEAEMKRVALLGK